MLLLFYFVQQLTEMSAVCITLNLKSLLKTSIKLADCLTLTSRLKRYFTNGQYLQKNYC